METKPPTIDYAAPPKRVFHWGRAWLFALLMPIAAASGGALASLHGWGWDIRQTLETFGETLWIFGCVAFAATVFASPFALLVAELGRCRALVLTLLAALTVFAAGYILGREMLIVMYA